MVARVYFPKGDTQNRDRLEAYINEEVVDEDVAITGGVQIGLESGGRTWGPLLAEREDSIRWFAAQIWERLAPAFR
jgi:hypothetical protein